MDFIKIFRNALDEGKIENLRKVREINIQIKDLINNMPTNDTQNQMLWKTIDKLRLQISRLLK